MNQDEYKIMNTEIKIESVILTTGGTGGHIFPALAVAEGLIQHNTKMKIIFIGSNYGPEHKIVKDFGLEFVALPVRGVLGRGFKAISSIIRIIFAIFKSIFLIFKYKPQIIMGFGGYASFAPLVAGYICRIPLVLHEQNAVPGLSNKILSKLCTKICVSLPKTQGFAADKCVLTGNPVRRVLVELGKKVFSGKSHDILEKGYIIDEAIKPPRKKLLIMGGSQGARAINNYIVENLEILSNNNVEILHQTGISDFEYVQKKYQHAGYSEQCVKSFMQDMDKAYLWADLVLCRAGASSVAELAIMGKAAILIPFPSAANDHQTYNANTYAELGAAIVVPEKDMHKIKLLDLIITLLSDQKALQKMSEAAYAQAKPDAARMIVGVMHDVLLHN